MIMTVETGKQTLEFQTEVRQLLNLMIHSLYSNKEIYLRELISNASDACDKLRFEALSDEALYQGDSDLRIRVTFDKDKRTITVSDNGIGMSRDELIGNLGTIARSGTAEFLQQHPRVVSQSVAFTAETDSLNASILGPDAMPGTPEFDLYIKEVVREMTSKAGQKCTAIRRIIAPAAIAGADTLNGPRMRLSASITGAGP